MPPALQTRSHHLRSLPVVLALLCAPAGATTLYLCRDGNDGQIYQSDPCPKGALIRTIEEDARIDTVPAPRAGSSAKTPAARGASDTRAGARSRRQATPAGDAAERAYVREGMDEAQVLLRIGPPNLRSTGRAPSGHGRVVRWVYLPATGDADTITTVMMQGGLVVAVERKLSR